MKKLLACLLTLVLTLSLLAACGGQENSPAGTGTPADVASVKTLGEAMDLAEDGTVQSATYEDSYVYVFKNGDAYWRLTAALDAEQSAALSALDILDENYDAKLKELLTPIAVTKCENLNEQKLSDEELAALVGKTGADLLADGWVSGMGYNLDEMQFFMERPPFAYTVTFESGTKLENTDDFDEEEAIKPLKVVSVTFDGIGDTATDLPETETAE